MTAEDAKEIKASRLWDLIVAELKSRVDTEFSKFRTCSQEDLRFIQTRVQILEEIKNLPDAVIGREE